MEVYVARQPIFNKIEHVVAYELLYRSDNKTNAFSATDEDSATIDVLINSFLNIGISELSQGKPCFINFTKKLLEMDLPTFFNPNEIVIEILENVTLNEELVNICKHLHELGYSIALDDFSLDKDNPYLIDLIKYIDIVKVDFLNTTVNMRHQIEEFTKSHHIHLLAEKVETREDFEEAKKSGYVLFQGYFFAKPAILSAYDVPTYIHIYYDIIQKLAEEEPDFQEIAELIERDISLAYKLLKLINSPALRPRYKIHSITQAITYLGLHEIKRWIHVLSLREFLDKKLVSPEVTKTCLLRAKMCEEIAKLQNKSSKDTGYFMTGLFSLMDSLTGAPMEEILKDLPISDDVTNALTGEENLHKQVLDLAIATIKGEWETVQQHAQTLEINEKDVFHIYRSSLNWVNQLY